MNSHYPAPGERPADHPYAKLFPMMGEAETNELAGDIKAHGLREPLVILDNQLLDGRNRYAACLIAKVDPEWRFYDPKKDGKSPLQFVMGKNLKRRHLTPSQAAAVAAEALPLFEKEAAARKGAHQFKPTGTTVEITGQTGVQVEESELVPTNVVPMSATGGVDLQGPPEEELAPTSPAPKPPTPGPMPGDEFDQRTPGSEEFGHETPPAPKPPKKTSSKPARTVVKKDEEPAPSGNGKASEAAAAAVGVSARSVETAKHLKETAPEQFEQVKAGAKSLHKAAQEAAWESDEVQEAMLKIRRVCGQSFHDAVKDQTRLKGPKEVLAYAALDDEKMRETRGLIESGWTVKEAVKYKAGALCRTHKIGDLLNRAAHAGGTFTLEIEGYVVSVHRQTDALPATAAKAAAAASKKKNGEQ